jgi:cathepsin A (carboxypeptidase C)
LSQNKLHPHQPQVNLKSILVGNGWFSPLDTIFGYWETLCTTKPGVEKPIFNNTLCDMIASGLPRCMDVLRVCNDHRDAALCETALRICNDTILTYFGYNEKGGRNVYDITKPCEIAQLCYVELGLIEQYLNEGKVWKALGIPEAIDHYNLTSDAVGLAFAATNDFPISMEPQVLYLLNSGIDILIYQGNLDLASNTAGNLRWTNSVSWKGQAEYVSKSLQSWTSGGKKAGKFKEVRTQVQENQKDTRFTLVTVDDAGHMVSNVTCKMFGFQTLITLQVPMDRPDIALDLMSRWISGKYFD